MLTTTCGQIGSVARGIHDHESLSERAAALAASDDATLSGWLKKKGGAHRYAYESSATPSDELTAGCYRGKLRRGETTLVHPRFRNEAALVVRQGKVWKAPRSVRHDTSNRRAVRPSPAQVVHRHKPAHPPAGGT